MALAGLQVGFETKTVFFDAQKVSRLFSKAERKYLVRSSSLLRTTARRRIRKPTGKKKASAAGESPRSQTGILKDSILFGLELASSRAVVGPAAGFGSGKRGTPTVPNILEEGGQTIVTDKPKASDFGARPTIRKRITIDARPFMIPAAEAVSPKFPEIWNEVFGK